MRPPILLTDKNRRSPQTLARYRQDQGYQAIASALADTPPHRLVDLIEAAGLRGRGGARFPAATKWRLALEATAEQKYVVANGGEHEPGSDKDKFLVEHYPHKVIEGMLLCGFATGASRGWLYLIDNMAGPIASAQAAIDEARREGMLGEHIMGSSFSFDIEIHRAPMTYVAGEETAAIDSIEGGEGKPRSKPPYPGQSGVHGSPTTVNNVETLAHVPWIVQHGPENYAAIGTAESKGTMLFTLGSEVNRPGVYELPFGATYRQLIEECGGGITGGRAIRAVLPALSCAFLGAEHLDVPIGYETLAELGSSPGCGGVHLFLEGDDVVARVAKIAQFFMDEQCGQCPPCRMQTSQLAHVLKGVLSGVKGDYLGQMEKVAAFTRGKGDCSLIEMAAAPVLSGARLFGADFEAKAQ
ncbi:MAG: hypothetical protein CMJ85_04545 [Planctomycetes bacterium]|nr:hypothetical protein [Planctomycetota bacterium]